MKLYLKGDRCYSEKCSIERRNYPPGQHGQARMRKFSEYGIQMREKQKVRRIYMVLERQFASYFKKADRMKGITGYNLLLLLERRLDNVVFRMGFAVNRGEARHLVTHGHFSVNGRKVNIPSYQVKIDDVVQVREKSRNLKRVQASLESVDRRGVPSWVDVDKGAFKGVVKAYPDREELTMPIQEQLIVELYSK